MRTDLDRKQTIESCREAHGDITGEVGSSDIFCRGFRNGHVLKQCEDGHHIDTCCEADQPEDDQYGDVGKLEDREQKKPDGHSDGSDRNEADDDGMSRQDPDDSTSEGHAKCGTGIALSSDRSSGSLYSGMITMIRDATR